MKTASQKHFSSHANGRFRCLKTLLFSMACINISILLSLIPELMFSPGSLSIPTAPAYLQSGPRLAGEVGEEISSHPNSTSQAALLSRAAAIWLHKLLSPFELSHVRH